jgi:prepilin peptidase CpaA
VTRSIEVTLVLLIGIAAWSDLRTRRIPNWITVPGAVMGFVLQTWTGGLHGTWAALAGTALGLAIFIGLFVAGGMGAGDVKLFGAVGSLVGPQALVLVFVFTGLLGGIAAIGLAAFHGRLPETLNRTKDLLTGTAGEQLQPSLKLPYGVMIAGGVLIWMMVASS